MVAVLEEYTLAFPSAKLWSFLTEYRSSFASLGSPGGVNGGGGTSVRSLVSQSNARKWSEELFEEKMANRRQEREQSTSRIVRGEESMSSDFGGMPPQHPIRGNLTYPNIPRDASGEGSSPGEWQGHSPMPSSLPPTVPLASRSPISRRPARSPASFRRSQTASNFMPSPRSRVPLPSPRSGMPLKKVPARTAM
ncbi:hypothetical protein Pmar_PMAR022581 [Perkinsus marinus ATCC 50983]|uniref:Uncharacterized protein n=1 Tax=Perkinsus marinus (strain ATCC 50983 / TXsc) TaxID=423536 RepID=C5KFI5_PERM5|nr:hypothetical protein Pmar_PMAR022581 [Perkinsus marinus ATCC 50983]EER16734.1 hypothetical protein Pmar_PMAR022581 [Perkinsus marinus ATCC 50983]|eukprot:XP_002784938.1 hypothetical protein Pmar_PMAR022581 [Perkinsus marinus ATCC 50983]